ncbi:Mannosyl-oligosaccharide 1-2-alpha-mannosidase [Penicillium macrosclerotiorum]|uniref:Mannosyl-oligosaccharide 1-2-alpha-mannosidase n=1 Tax=Penicillium macrosclerotiorum TaxID=303699 RepID=UPI00254795DE|nr:Mannosyl-oligosaccharide 1-2-alpha-mannosidase [Penicillium macrosclerotiorum]KAJ5678649.1 Mannosyl-oligosaccharide 1-2-alpha-mannosidase [Penicillium macrosclerotiorum]
MSFQPQRGVPSFQASNVYQDPRARANQNSQGLAGLGISNKVGGFFEPDRTLPMYKDKPYFTPKRTAPRKRWRPIFVLGLCALVFLWYYKTSAPVWKTADLGEPGVELWKWSQTLESEAPSKGQVDWAARREKVRDVFKISWDGYEKEAWGFDEYNPVSGKNRNMVKDGMGWIIVDALDTMILMNLTSQVRHAREWISTSLRYDQDHDVSTFETTIRMLGGLLSAHYLSTQYPTLAPIADDDVGAAGEDLYIEKATDLADRLLGAFESPTGIPYASVNLNKSEGLPSHGDGGASSTAEATSIQLEFKYLAKLTGEAEYWKAVEKVMQVLDEQQPEGGLVPIYIHPQTGKFRGENIRLGSRGDSYYEYLIKQYLQTSEQEPVYKEMWDESLLGIRKHLLAFSKNAQLMVLGERPDGLGGSLSPKMDHLVCFLPGTYALGATGGKPLSEARKSPAWSQQREEEILISRELMKTCWATYLATATGLAPEISHFILDSPPVMMADKYPDPRTPSEAGVPHELRSISQTLSPQADGSEPWRNDIEIHRMDRHNLQRPETIESLFYMYRITGDEIYREWGWDMFKAFVKHTAVIENEGSDIENGKVQTVKRIKGFTSLSNANTIPPERRDNMESFWMAETLKYFYLLFSDRGFISLEDHVFNTEAHPLPRFKPTGELRTGWQRKTNTQIEQ